MNNPLVSPTIRLDADNKPVMEGGMSLRQYFAASALAGLCANSALFDAFKGTRSIMMEAMKVTAEEADGVEHKILGRTAMRIADATLLEMEAKP